MSFGVLIPLEAEGYAPPGVEDFHFDGGFIPGLDWVNKPFIQAVIATILIIGYWVWISRRLEIVPSKKQYLAEFFYNFVRNNIAREVLGKDYKKYLPYLLALFTFILVNNLFGVFFLFMYPTFSNIGFAYGLAFISWCVYVGSGFYKHGIGYLKKALLPEGVPFYLYWLIIPLEFISNFVTRPITLALRLFANLFAGHLVIMVFVLGGTYLISVGGAMAAAGGLSIAFSFAIFALEIFVGGLQAFIFTVLTAQYVASSLADDH
ncbi:MAG: ATP synthase F0 subunit A [Propionibacterium sp.]|nr:MAG: ATP synthase F0 subunit A [Propionibacterium sp.]